MSTPPETRETERQRIRRGILYCLRVFLSMRVGLWVLGLVAVALLPHPGPAVSEAAGIPLPVGVPGWDAQQIAPGWHNLVTAFERFDALWFLRIADTGYAVGDGSAAFFPLYPMVVRVFSWLLGGHPLAAGLLVSNLAFLGALIVVYFLTASERGEEAARRTVLYLAIFPTAFFFLAPYSESLFLLLAATALWGARRERWWIAGVAGALAAGTRSLGVLLVLPLAVEAIHRWREDGRRLAGPLAWSAAVSLGLLAYLAFWQVTAGDFRLPFTEQATWQREGTFFLATLVEGTRLALRYPGIYPGGYHLLDWLVVSPALAFGGWIARRTRPIFSVYVWASLLAPLSLVFPPRPLMSLPRFLLPLFPLLWAPAAWGERRRGIHEAWVAVSAAGLGVMTLLFVNWQYVF